VPLNDVYKYKYLINVDGNVAAYRLGFLLGTGSVVLIVEGKYKLWFQQWLKENIHYISIKEDLSDLKEKIEWCINHDEECQKIAENSVKFFNERLTLEPIYDYMINTIKQL
jgi:siroheme synthase (precorrin-2 oxidase/ferrochelatase)